MHFSSSFFGASKDVLAAGKRPRIGLVNGTLHETSNGVPDNSFSAKGTPPSTLPQLHTFAPAVRAHNSFSTTSSPSIPKLCVCVGTTSTASKSHKEAPLPALTALPVQVIIRSRHKHCGETLYSSSPLLGVTARRFLSPPHPRRYTFLKSLLKVTAIGSGRTARLFRKARHSTGR